MKQDHMQRLTDIFARAFHQLGVEAGHEISQLLAQTIHEAMSAAGRYYHTPDHVLALTDDHNPTQSLAALFHDVVYYQVDGGFSAQISEILEPYLQELQPGRESIRLVDAVDADDLSFHLVKDLFGFSMGMELPSPYGTNEFLSSLVMAKKLEDIVPGKVLAQVSAYIEATIPFRTAETHGYDPFERLADRLKEAANKYDLPLSREEINATVRGAVLFANQDVSNFTRQDAAAFLDGTWRLLPEFNSALRTGRACSLGDYRQALQAMRGFLCSIREEAVLHAYRGTQPEAELAEKQSAVRRNLDIGCQYLEVKLLTAAILEAIGETLTDDVPLAQFLADICKNGYDEPGRGRLILPAVETADGVERLTYLHQLLRTPRRGPMDYADDKTSLLALYIYEKSGMEKIRRYLIVAEGMFTGRIMPSEFLQALDQPMLAVVRDAISQAALERDVKPVVTGKKG